MSEYIVIKTFCDKEENTNAIKNILLEKHLVAGIQIYKLESKYWWNNEIESSSEFLLEGRTKKYLFDEIVQEIKKIHLYQLPEISYYEIGGSKEFLNWIDKNIK